MKQIKTFRELIQFTLEIYNNNDCPEGMTIGITVSKEIRLKIFSEMMNYDIDYDYIKNDDLGFYFIRHLGMNITLF